MVSILISQCLFSSYNNLFWLLHAPVFPPIGDGACHPRHPPVGHSSSDSAGLPPTFSCFRGGEKRRRQGWLWGGAAPHPQAAQRHAGRHVCVWLPLPGCTSVTCCCGITELCSAGPEQQGPRSAGCDEWGTGGALPGWHGESQAAHGPNYLI